MIEKTQKQVTARDTQARREGNLENPDKMRSVECLPNKSAGTVLARHALTIVFVLAFLLQAPDAYAYIDPGTGSLLFQTGLALLLGAGLVFRHAWRRIARAIAWLFKPVKPSSRNDNSE
ncbi:MAG: hypothetical protein NTY02_12885 [Acidobacteria bacterium]|nr:hypothetical protein [Acidobacteriota bacterium]